MAVRTFTLSWLALGFMVLVLAAGYAAPKSDRPAIQFSLEPPSSLHWMGTDQLGRDVAARTLRAGALSLGASALAWLGAVVLGLALGSYAAYQPRSWCSSAVRGFVAVFYTTPFFVVLVGVVGALGPGLWNAYLVLALVAWAAPARHTASIVSPLRQASFVVATQSFGYGPGRVLRYAILPRAYRPVVAASLAVLPEILALDAALSFFGLGARPPTPTIGRMVVEGVSYLSVAWWMVVSPVAILAALCLATRVLAQGVQR